MRVRLLGGLDLRLGELPVPALDSARAESLLAYPLLHRDAPQARKTALKDRYDPVQLLPVQRQHRTQRRSGADRLRRNPPRHTK